MDEQILLLIEGENKGLLVERADLEAINRGAEVRNVQLLASLDVGDYDLLLFATGRLEAPDKGDTTGILRNSKFFTKSISFLDFLS